MGSRIFSISVSVDGPLRVLPSRALRIAFAFPSPLLRALGPNERPDNGIWSLWLSEWGWTWVASAEDCHPVLPLMNIFHDRINWPQGFDPRAILLSVALELRVDGEPLKATQTSRDLRRVWKTISSLSREELGEILALALIRAKSEIYDFNSVAPSWPTDVGRVVAERSSLLTKREPAPVWLKSGYELLGDTFGLLRSMGTSLEVCNEIWGTYSSGCKPPWAYEMAFWWEATYFLTECHAYEAADEAQKKVAGLAEALEKLTGLVDRMWHHQQGRLYYYAGRFEEALTGYVDEIEIFGKDLKVAAMLNRDIANVLSDLGCSDAALHFAETSVRIAREQAQETELYKSLGRHAEISIKLGDLPGAENLLRESLAIQEKLGDPRAPAQTITYLGHIALLKGDLDKARDWYARAGKLDANSSLSSLPYMTMGLFALTAAESIPGEMKKLWDANKERIKVWGSHQTHILPASVCVLAATRFVPSAQLALPGLLDTLVENRYAIEAAYALPDLSEKDKLQIEKIIEKTLNQWQKNLGSLPSRVKTAAGPLNGPAKIVEAMRRYSLHGDHELRATCYPMTLIRR